MATIRWANFSDSGTGDLDTIWILEVLDEETFVVLVAIVRTGSGATWARPPFFFSGIRWESKLIELKGVVYKN